jgi:hypothetical protein
MVYCQRPLALAVCMSAMRVPPKPVLSATIPCGPRLTSRMIQADPIIR